MLFFLPSLIFWTADVSKESTHDAVARAGRLRRRPRSSPVSGVDSCCWSPGVTIGYYIRPNELLLVLSGFAVAMMLPTAQRDRTWAGLRRFFSLRIPRRAAPVHLVYRDPPLSPGRRRHPLAPDRPTRTTRAWAPDSDSSGVPYSTNSGAPIRGTSTRCCSIRLIFKAHGNAQRVAGLENTILIVLILKSLRNLRILPRAAFARPYVMLCIVYTHRLHLHLRRPREPGTDRARAGHAAALPVGAVVYPAGAEGVAAALPLGVAAQGAGCKVRRANEEARIAGARDRAPALSRS